MCFSEFQLMPAPYQRLKASLWFSIGKIVDEETQRLNSSATPQFIGTMTEMVWNQIGMDSTFRIFQSGNCPPASPKPTTLILKSSANIRHRKCSTRPRILLPPCRTNNSHNRRRTSDNAPKRCFAWYHEGFRGEGAGCCC
jgi:hypothetical protein